MKRSEIKDNLNLLINRLEMVVEISAIASDENVAVAALHDIATLDAAKRHIEAWDKVIHELEIMAHFDGTCKASFVLNKINKHLEDVKE